MHAVLRVTIMENRIAVLNGCSMCSYASTSLDALTKHVCKAHKHHPRFMVYCKSCLRSYTKWNSYLRHLKRGCHSYATNSDTGVTGHTSTTMNDDFDNVTDEMMDIDSVVYGNETENKTDSQWHQAAYILSIKEKYGLSQVAVDHIVESTKGLMTEFLNGFLNQTVSKHVSTETLNYLKSEAVRISSNLFKDLSTSYLQKKYFKSNFDYIVSVYNNCNV